MSAASQGGVAKLGRNAGRFGGVSAGERDLGLIGEGEQAVEEAVDPAWLTVAGDGEFAGQCDREKCSDWASTHGG